MVVLARGAASVLNGMSRDEELEPAEADTEVSGATVVVTPAVSGRGMSTADCCAREEEVEDTACAEEREEEDTTGAMCVGAVAVTATGAACAGNTVGVGAEEAEEEERVF